MIQKKHIIEQYHSSRYGLNQKGDVMTLTTVWRPGDLDGIIGNESTVKTLESKLAQKREKFPHAISIFGPTGCGKTTLGRIIGNELGAQEADFREIDSADFTGVDSIRNIRKGVRMAPADPKSKCRVWLLDECHMLSPSAQNALLKALEDPPDHVYFILCTTEPKKLLATIRGRCFPLNVNPLSDRETEVLLRKVIRAEKKTVPSEVRELIAEQSFGHPRNALQLLSKVIDLPEDEMAEIVEEEAAKQTAAIELFKAILDKKPWKTIATILKGLRNEDEEGLRRMILKCCETALLKGDNKQAFIVMEEFEDNFYNSGKPGLLLACYRSRHA